MKSILSSLMWILAVTTTEMVSGQTAITRSSFNVSILVIDDQDKPVVDADAGFSWGLIGAPKTDSGHNRKLTTQDGIAKFSGSTGSNVYAYGATKDGYYPSRGLHGSFDRATHGQWQPWPNQLRVVLKPIKNPVPMYVKRIEAFIPELGKPVGYDLERGDWVEPYGKGVQTDFEFTAEGKMENELNYSGVLKLGFPGAGNGIQSYELDPVQRSAFKLPYEAPKDGYQEAWVWHNSRETPVAGRPSVFVDESNDQRAFIYRVRTALNPQGQIIRANYGKIYGPIYFSPRLNGKWVIGITYYYNPDETRNLECDPKRNLFPRQKEGIEP